MDFESYIIIGGGLTGLSYAYNKLKKGYGVIIFEKDKNIGGLMQTYNFGGFLFDFGPHLFRSKDEKVLNFVKELLGNNYHNIPSNPSIFKYGMIFDNTIPVITRRNIELLPENIKEKVKHELNNLDKNKEVDLSNFKSCIVSQIGETLYWEFFGEYSKKWWGIDPEKLSSDLAPKNIKIDEKKSYGHITTDFGRVSEELYPIHGGIFEIVRRLAEKISNLGGEIQTNYYVKDLDIDGDTINSIIVEHNNEEFEIPVNDKKIISTMPLDKLCNMLNIRFDLQYRADICVFIKVRTEKLMDYSWMYFHDSDVIFSRIYEPKYYSKYNAPKGYTSLCVEVTCFKDDKTWNDKYLGDKVVEELISLNIIKKSYEPEILGMVKTPYAYPIYTVDYKQKLDKIFNELDTYKNLKVIGRTGSFKYENMWECLRWAVY